MTAASLEISGNMWRRNSETSAGPHSQRLFYLARNFFDNLTKSLLQMFLLQRLDI